MLIIKTQISAKIKVINLNFWYSLINKIITTVDKFKKKKADLSPDIKINISTKINKIPKEIDSYFFFFLIKNKANNKGNSLDKYEPIINSSPKKDETLVLLLPINFNPNKFCPVKY